ncbi:hypothetical protein [Desulfococcus sp.]
MGMLSRGFTMVSWGRCGNVFRFMSPRILTRDQARKAVEILLEVSKTV